MDTNNKFNFLQYFIVVICLVLGVYFGVNIFLQNSANYQNGVNYHIKDLVSKISNRLQTYADVLNSGRALFQSSDEVNRDEWKIFIDAQNIFEKYPGIQGLGYVKVFQPSEKTAVEKKIISEGFPEFKIFPEGQRDLYSSIIYIEPFNEKNKRVFGYDMFSESVRKSAMITSRDKGFVILSGKVKLLQETETNGQPGFLLYFPFYYPELNPQNIESRQKNLQGFIYAPFRANDFMNAIMQNNNIDISFKLFSGTETSEENLLYTFNENQFNKSKLKATTTKIEQYGNTWTIVTKPFVYTNQDIYLLYLQPFLTFLAFLTVALLIVKIINVKRNYEKTAELLANQQTKDLTLQNSLLVNIIQKSIYSIIVVDKKGLIIFTYNNENISNISQKMYSLGRNIYEYLPTLTPELINHFIDDPKNKSICDDCSEEILKNELQLLSEKIQLFISTIEYNSENQLLLFVTEKTTAESTQENKKQIDEIIKLNAILVERENRMAELKKQLEESTKSEKTV